MLENGYSCNRSWMSQCPVCRIILFLMSIKRFLECLHRVSFVTVSIQVILGCILSIFAFRILRYNTFQSNRPTAYFIIYTDIRGHWMSVLRCSSCKQFHTILLSPCINWFTSINDMYSFRKWFADLHAIS